MTAAERLMGELEGVTGLVSTARQVLSDGRGVDLAGLDGRVGRLCAEVRKLSERDAAGFRPRLLALVDELDRLERELQAHRAKLAQALGSLAAGKQAATAYGGKGSPGRT